MSIPSKWRFVALLGLVVAAVLPWIGHRVRQHPQLRCALDGAAIHPALRVRILSGHGEEQQFCSLFCAEKWLKASRVLPEAILVTDEGTGEEVNAAKAFFVRSQVVAHGPTGERRHVFRQFQDAKSHAESHLGRVLMEDERPFASWLQQQRQPVAKQFTTPSTVPNQDFPKL